ncbi:MAG: hypothetical protein WDO19_03175 [Bacteroidota bacterium]
MSSEIQQQIMSLVSDLSIKSGQYGKALSTNAGFDKRREIRKEIRLIEKEIAELKEKLKTIK